MMNLLYSKKSSDSTQNTIIKEIKIMRDIIIITSFDLNGFRSNNVKIQSYLFIVEFIDHIAMDKYRTSSA
jgi:hypothetical protein